MQLLAFTLLALASSVVAFRASIAPRHQSSTVLFEDFKGGAQGSIGQKPGDPLWSEKQLREFTATYSEDIRYNPLDLLLGLFKKNDEASAEASSLGGALKSSISLKLLEEKTAAFVQGKIDAKAFKGVLASAFGDKLNKVLPEILANLPTAKASALSKL